MVNELAQFAVGIGILLVSTESFVNFAKKISLALKISPLVVGVTIVSIGTSLPEFAVSVMASLKDDPGLALGNILGSNIINTFLVLPVGILIGRLRIGSTKTQRSAVLMLMATILFVVMIFTDYPRLFIGAIFLLAATFVTFAEYIWGIEGRKREDVKSLSRARNYSIHPVSMIFVMLSTFGIIIGGSMTVGAIEKIAVISGLSTTILGLSMSAIATSMPELMATIFSQGSKSEKITVGNILGSQIYNLLLVGGTILFFSQSYSIKFVDWAFFGAQALLLGTIIFKFSGQVVPKMVGVALLGILLLYFISLGFMHG